MTGDGVVEARLDPPNLDGATLAPALAENRLAIIEFWADWCLFSRLLRPKTQRLAEHYGDRLLVARCRLDQREAAERIGIRYLPAMALFRAGKPLRTWYGDAPESLYARGIESLLENADD